jgi:hypothetical protein
MLPLALDGALALLLVLSLGLGLKLHRALRRLRDDNTDFDRLIGAIDGATDRARSVLDDLKRAAARRASAWAAISARRSACSMICAFCASGASGWPTGWPDRSSRAAGSPCARMLLRRALDRCRPLPIWSARSGPCDESVAMAAPAASAQVSPGRSRPRAARDDRRPRGSEDRAARAGRRADPVRSGATRDAGRARQGRCGARDGAGRRPGRKHLWVERLRE